MKNVLFSLTLILSMSTLASAHEDKKCPAPPPSSATFNEMKQLVGTWKGTMPGPDGKPAPVSTQFRLVAANSAIEEDLMPGTESEMVDMYADEDGKLAMVHYCAVGNRPHMTLKSASPNQISFEMGKSAGINPKKDVHMHALTLEFPDSDHLVEHWVSYKDGKVDNTVVFTMTRVKN